MSSPSNTSSKTAAGRARTLEHEHSRTQCEKCNERTNTARTLVFFEHSVFSNVLKELPEHSSNKLLEHSSNKLHNFNQML